MISDQKEYAEAWNKLAPKDDADGFDVSKFEDEDDKAPIKLASGNGLSMPTNRAIGELNRDIAPQKEVEHKAPEINKQYVRPPGVQPMTQSQEQDLQSIRKRREQERQRLMGQ